MDAQRLTQLMLQMRPPGGPALPVILLARGKPHPPQPILPARAAAILVEVGVKHGYTTEQLQGPSRERPVVRARWEAMYRLFMECRWMSSQMVGKALCRDHSTALYAIKKYASLKNLPATREEQTP